MRNAILTLALIASGCCSCPKDTTPTYRKIITQEEYNQLNLQEREMYDNFFDYYQRIPVEGEPDYEEYMEACRVFEGWDWPVGLGF